MPATISIPKRRGKARVKIIEKRKMTQAMLKELSTDNLDVRPIHG